MSDKVITVPCKTIITKVNNSNWFAANYNMNIYRGCSHGCIYCDSRSDCYQNKEFDKVKIKENAINIIRNQLKGLTKTGVIATGSMSDPYNPLEEKFELTRQALELINKYQFGVAIATKSPLILRDIDILKKIATHSPIIVKITITTADDELCKKIEESVAIATKRFEAVKKLNESGIYTGILMMPILPYINDSIENILSIVEKGKIAGAKFIYPAMGLTLRDSQREFFYKKLDEKFTGVKAKYISDFGLKYSCGSKNAKNLFNIFSNKCKTYNIMYRMKDIITDYNKEYKESSFFDEIL